MVQLYVPDKQYYTLSSVYMISIYTKFNLHSFLDHHYVWRSHDPTLVHFVHFHEKKEFIPPFFVFASFLFLFLHLFCHISFTSFCSHLIYSVIVRLLSSYCLVIVQLSSDSWSSPSDSLILLSYSNGGLLCEFIQTFFCNRQKQTRTRNYKV